MLFLPTLINFPRLCRFLINLSLVSFDPEDVHYLSHFSYFLHLLDIVERQPVEWSHRYR